MINLKSKPDRCKVVKTNSGCNISCKLIIITNFCNDYSAYLNLDNKKRLIQSTVFNPSDGLVFESHTKIGLATAIDIPLVLVVVGSFVLNIADVLDVGE